jgi:4-hydroxy-3-methylbut-2-en-1-yl diphosphate synthase IspG/GcpE
VASERQIKVERDDRRRSPVVVQSVTLTRPGVEATIAQIAALASAGCEIARVAVRSSRSRGAAAHRPTLSDP